MSDDLLHDKITDGKRKASRLVKEINNDFFLRRMLAIHIHTKGNIDNNIKECVQCITIEDYQSIKNKRCLTKILELDVKEI